jgi:hypothetical protein
MRVLLGTPFNTTLSKAASRVLRIRAHDGTVLFRTPFLRATWHNFAVVVDWDNLTLKVFYSSGAHPLKAVTTAEDNSSAARGPKGQGDFHFGVLKVRRPQGVWIGQIFDNFITHRTE